MNINTFKQQIIVFVSAIIMGQTLHARSNFVDEASTLMLNSLSTQSKESFLRQLYTQLFFVPVWMKEYDISRSSHDLFTHIKSDLTLEESSQLYKDTIFLEKRANTLYHSESTLSQKIEIEFKISQLYKEYTDYAYLGSINWGAFQARISNLIVNDVRTEWVLDRPAFDAINILENVVFGVNMAQALEEGIPKKYHYQKLQQKLQEYREIRDNGGWKKVTLLEVPKLHQSYEGIPTLRERLSVTKDYTPCEGEPLDTFLYTACLNKAVKHFQKRNGLAVDGAVGRGTLGVLNKSVNNRITTILLNLDRIKWLYQAKGTEHNIIMNIPAFTLFFEEEGKLIQTIRTIVGKPKNPTPIFSNIVRTIVLNPYWNLPNSIIQKEMIPKLMRNSNAMKRKRIEIRRGWGKNAPLVNPSTVNWAKYKNTKRLPFRFAQLPGNRNALGKIKFLFPNKYAVYMHDTPAKTLFGRTKRAFSHGCIRLQKPRELLATFSKFNDNIDLNVSKKILKGKKETVLNLKERVPVNVIYLTAWVDYEGKLQFYNDIYGYDKMQLKSFRRW